MNTKTKLTPEQVAYDLFQIHDHMPESDINQDEETGEIYWPEPGIVYREEQLIKLFRKWGIPKPNWKSKKYLALFKAKKR